MFKNWGSWLLIEGENLQAQTQEDSVLNVNSDKGDVVNKQTPAAGNEQISGAVKKESESAQFIQPAKGFSGYFYNFASTASKKLSESVVETAQTLKKSVEEGKIHGIIDKTFLGDFQKEQQKFVEEKKAKNCSAAVPPWAGYNDEDTVQQQILALSTDKRNVLRDPPTGVHFHFDFERMYPVAMVMLEEDELLRKMRFLLVPKQVKEEIFWRNYFYRVSLIKQSAELTALAAQQAAERTNVDKSASSHKDPHQNDFIKWKSPSATSNSKVKSSEDEEGIASSPPVSEFVSDAFDSCKINEDDLHREMEQLVLDKQVLPSKQHEEIADWEKELQEELQEYEVLADNENHDDVWDREIEEMLKADT